MPPRARRPDWTSGTREAHVPGIGAKTVLTVRLFKKTRPMGKGSSMDRLTPTMETVPPVATHDRASSTVASAPTASITESAPHPPVASSTWAEPGASRASIGSAPSASARASRSGTMSMARILAGPKSAAHWSAMMPTGPSPTTATVEPGRMEARCAPR